MLAIPLFLLSFRHANASACNTAIACTASRAPWTHAGGSLDKITSSHILRRCSEATHSDVCVRQRRPFSSASAASPVAPATSSTRTSTKGKDKESRSSSAAAATSAGPLTGASLNQREVAKFAAMASEWWSPNGPFAPLLALNPPRCTFIRDSVCSVRDRDPSSIAEPLAGLRVLDVGCGGGLLSEPLARMGAQVSNILLNGTPQGNKIRPPGSLTVIMGLDRANGSTSQRRLPHAKMTSSCPCSRSLGKCSLCLMASRTVELNGHGMTSRGVLSAGAGH